MNKRMIELYQEASEFAYKICREEGREGGTSDHIWNTLSTGRFAELIVRECAKIPDSLSKLYPRTDIGFDVGYTMGTRRAAKRIKEHFEIKD